MEQGIAAGGVGHVAFSE